MRSARALQRRALLKHALRQWILIEHVHGSGMPSQRFLEIFKYLNQPRLRQRIEQIQQ